jgi:hypothetical protein
MDFTAQIHALELKQRKGQRVDAFSDKRSGVDRRQRRRRPPEGHCRRKTSVRRREQHHFENANWWLQRSYVDSDILVLTSK